MKEYICQGSVRFRFGMSLLIYGGATAFVVLMPVLNPVAFHSTGERVGMILPVALFFGGAACWGLIGLLHTFAVYRLDESGIVKRAWNGSEQQFAWRELVHVESTRKGSMTLTDFRAQTMSIPPFSYGYHSQDGYSLRQALDSRLTGLQDALKPQLAEPREFRARANNVAMIGVFVAVLWLVMGICIPLLLSSSPSSSASPPPPAFMIGFPAFSVLSALFFVYITLMQTTRVITLTDTGILDRNLFGKREIPFAEITSVTSKDVPGRSTTTEWSTVASAKTRIAFSALLPNYDGLVQAIHGHIGAQVRENTPTAIVVESRRIQIQTVLSLLVIGSLCSIVFGSIAMTGLHDGQASLARQTALSARGVVTEGHVTGTETRGSKSTVYYVNYSFQVEGHSYSHYSSVTSADYEQIRVGEVVRVTYLPDKPDVSRIAQSTARERALEQIQSGKTLLGFACVLPILPALGGFSKKARYHAPRVRR